MEVLPVVYISQGMSLLLLSPLLLLILCLRVFLCFPYLLLIQDGAESVADEHSESDKEAGRSVEGVGRKQGRFRKRGI